MYAMTCTGRQPSAFSIIFALHMILHSLLVDLLPPFFPVTVIPPTLILTREVTVDSVGVGAGGAATGGTWSRGARSRGAGAGGAGAGGASSGGAGARGSSTGGASSGGTGAGGVGAGGASSGAGGVGTEETRAGGSPTTSPTARPNRHDTRFQALCQLERKEQEREEQERQELQRLDHHQQHQQQTPQPPPLQQLFPQVSGLRALGLPSSPPVHSQSPTAYGPTFPPPNSTPAVFSPPRSWSSPPIVPHDWTSCCPPRARPSSPLADLRTVLFHSPPCRSPPVSVLPSPPGSSLTVSSHPITNYYHVACPVVSRILASLVTDPRASPSSVSALTAAVADFASIRHLDYATRVVAAPPPRPLSVGGESALGCDILEDRQFEMEFLAATSPSLCAILLSLEGDPDALDIPTPRTYSEAVSGEWASQWKAAMDADPHAPTSMQFPLPGRTLSMACGSSRDGVFSKDRHVAARARPVLLVAGVVGVHVADQLQRLCSTAELQGGVTGVGEVGKAAVDLASVLVAPHSEATSQLAAGEGDVRPRRRRRELQRADLLPALLLLALLCLLVIEGECGIGVDRDRRLRVRPFCSSSRNRLRSLSA
ncbi:unnamed protein product [Closterium sp. NIES-54]